MPVPSHSGIAAHRTPRAPHGASLLDELAAESLEDRTAGAVGTNGLDDGLVRAMPISTGSNRLRMNVGDRYWRHTQTARRDEGMLYLNNNNSTEQFDEEQLAVAHEREADDTAELRRAEDDEDDEGFFGLIPSSAEMQHVDNFNLPSSYLRRYALSQRRADRDATVASMLPAALNEMATDEVIMDILGPQMEASSIFSHSEANCGRYKLPSSQLNTPINKRLDEFLYNRREMAVQYDKSKVWRGSHTSNSRKRSFRDVIGEREPEDPYEMHMFDEIRLKQCSFFKPGLCYKGVDDQDLQLTFIDVNMDELRGAGFLEFKSGHQLRKWLKSLSIGTKSSKRRDTLQDPTSNTLPFHVRIVDFERFDLRYKSYTADRLLGAFSSEARGIYSISRKNTYSIMYSNFINKQLHKWRLLKPFRGVTVEDHKYITTCVNCLKRLQSSFVLMQMSLQNDTDQTDFLMAMNKHSGEVELVSADITSDIDVGSLRRSALGQVNALDRVIRFAPGKQRYVSPSICIR